MISEIEPEFPGMVLSLVSECNGEKVGEIFVLSVPHIEGIWVKPELRGTTLGARLHQKAVERLKAMGASKVFAFASSDEIEDYTKRLGYKKLDWAVMEKEI